MTSGFSSSRRASPIGVFDSGVGGLTVLRALRHRLPWISMGMSNDFALAKQQGATHVRIGTALFGARR